MGHNEGYKRRPAAQHVCLGSRRLLDIRRRGVAARGTDPELTEESDDEADEQGVARQRTAQQVPGEGHGGEELPTAEVGPRLLDAW